MLKVFREEKKFLLSYPEYKCKDSYLSKLLHGDRHNGVNGYKVRSLYFDTVYDTDYFEKLSGIENRRKIRLRIYSPGDSKAKLEMKQKEGARQLKRSLTVSKEDALELIKGNYDVLLKYKQEEFALEIYAFMKARCYRPCTVVEYDRKAYIAKENNIRITFDSNIRASESNFDIFSDKLNLAPVMDLYNVVMEVKFNGFLLSYIKDMINSIDSSEISVSKYYLARHNAYNTHL
ncbi:MAG: polyphosphate polymerase domain-containing protein [Erysipelotrichaceae bacterium]